MRDRSAGSRSARVLDLSLGMMRSAAMKIKYFKSAHDFRRWLEKNHAITQELWVGYYKKSSRQPSITWPESVDEALCFGWIDGIRKSVDDLRYTSRFTPRRRGSIWSAVNIKRARGLSEKGLMKPPVPRSPAAPATHVGSGHSSNSSRQNPVVNSWTSVHLVSARH
jgi:hypothetical protein